MKLFNLLKKFIRKFKIWLFVLVIIAIVFSIFSQLDNQSKNGTLTVKAGDFVKKVSVIGNVVPAQDADLSFDSSGRVGAIYKKVGDKVGIGEVIASLASADIQADLLKAKADLEAEQAKLSELKTSDGGSTKVLNVKKEMAETLYNSFTSADDAIRNQTDQFFDNPRTSPDIVFAFSDGDLKDEIDEERKNIEYIFKKWDDWVAGINLDNYTDEQIVQTENNLIRIRDFLSRVSLAVNDFSVNEGVSAEEAERYRSAVSTARTEINEAISSLTTAKENIRSIKSEIPYQEAKVKSAEAVVGNYEAQLSKNSIFAPFSGTITKIDIERGESVSANSAVISIISNSNFQIETFIPEVNIKDLKIGDQAEINLDAFGKDIVFLAQVISIDPAETVKDGVSTYKTKFEFSQNDDRLKSGMTANVEITTERRSNVIAVPATVVYRKDKFDFVKVKVGNSLVEKQVTVGGFDVSGKIEIVSGLSVGEEIYLKPTEI